MTNTLWSKWGYEDKDLSDIPNAVGGYRCPNCGRLHNMESVYEVDGIVHYAVANIPGAVPNTSTMALTNATLRYAVALADKGWQKACEEDEALACGLNIVDGKIVFKAVADVFGL